MPTISIIVPVYKVEKYIHRCIDSILAQTFTDFEVILVDDGSPDNCPAICDEYAAKDSRVRVIHQVNGGVSAARNRGMDDAEGQFLCFVDSDDILNCKYCETLLNLLESTACDFAACGTYRFLEESELQNMESIAESRYYTNTDFLIGQINRQSEIGPCNKLFRREALAQIRFLPERRYEDVTFSVDLAKHLKMGIVYTKTPLYYYRVQPEGFMATQAIQKMADFVEAGAYLVRTAQEHFPEYLGDCLRYAINYPWRHVDTVYVKFTFAENKQYLLALQCLLQEHIESIEKFCGFSNIKMHRIRLFAKSKFLYGMNAYARLARVYLYQLIGKDAYADGHGI